MADTKIEWATKVWNPVTGCSKISPGCQNCYAERMAKRLAGRCGYPKDDPFGITLHKDKLSEPLKWRKPQMVFVCSMGDLFHEDVPDDWLDQIFWEMGHTHQRHTFLILTKRPERMRDWLLQAYRGNAPYPNIWLGVTVENQEMADKRIPMLLQAPAAKRFISVEPMLGPVDLNKWFYLHGPSTGFWYDCLGRKRGGGGIGGDAFSVVLSKDIDWVICGGETGPKARPIHPGWVRSLRDQCKEADVPFFFKSWGEWLPDNQVSDDDFAVKPGHPGAPAWAVNKPVCWLSPGLHAFKVGKKAAGRLLDGQEWSERPGCD